jgi:hypothetical protein
MGFQLLDQPSEMPPACQPRKCNPFCRTDHSRFWSAAGWLYIYPGVAMAAALMEFEPNCQEGVLAAGVS